jgi:peptidase A24-like protein
VERPAKRKVGGPGATEITDAVAIASLWIGFGYAAWTDWRKREVADHVWIAMAAIGLVLGIVRAWPAPDAAGWPSQFTGPSAYIPVGLWILVAGLALEHFVPWDEAVGRVREWLPGIIELLVYVVIGAILVTSARRWGLPTSLVPPLAAYVGIVLARVLFETRLLYGGADAKAMMVAGVVLPIWATPWLAVPATATTILAAYPFALTLLMDGAICAAAIPVALAIRNLRAGEFEFPRGFTGYRIPVNELPDRFVWVRDPTFDAEADEAETSEDDRKLRERQRDELLARGVTRIWVTPQLPFVILLAAGAVAGVLLGNLVFDVAALL